MPINELNAQEFAQNLAQQAMEYVPQEFDEAQKKYITSKVYQFSLITGEHLLKQYQEQFEDQQATIIIQFIGEWTFHKAIDLVRAGIDQQHWDQIMQQVAFAALKSAIHANVEKFEDVKTAAFIEYNVKSAYEECINQLVQANAISEEKKEEILSISNVDKMAEEQGGNVTGTPEEEERTMKYITIALFLKKMPEEKAQKILDNMDETKREKIQSCLQIQDLEKKVDASIINDYIKELKKNINPLVKPKTTEFIGFLKDLCQKYGEESIINLTLYERTSVQKFLSEILFESDSKALNVELSSYIVKILYNHLRSKLSGSAA